MTTVQDRFDEAGNITNPTVMYLSFIQQGVSAKKASEMKFSLQEEPSIKEKIKEFSGGLESIVSFEDISSEKVIDSLSTPDVEKNERRGKDGRS